MPGPYRALRSDFPEPHPGLHFIMADTIQDKGDRQWKEYIKMQDMLFLNEYLFSFEFFESFHAGKKKTSLFMKKILRSPLTYGIAAVVIASADYFFK